MASVAGWFKSGLFSLVFASAAIVAFALFAVLAIAMRPLMIVAFILAALATAALSAVSPAFRDWLEAVGEVKARATET
jgi:hypothetical protein